MSNTKKAKPRKPKSIKMQSIYVNWYDATQSGYVYGDRKLALRARMNDGVTIQVKIPVREVKARSKAK